MSSLCCISAAAEAVVLVEGPQHRELPARPRSAVARCVGRDGAASVFARLSCGLLYSTSSMSGDGSVLLHLEGSWPPSSVCLAPPTSRGSSIIPCSPMLTVLHFGPARPVPWGMPAAAPWGGTPGLCWPPRWLSEQLAPGLPFRTWGGFTVLFTCAPAPPHHENRIAFCTFVTKLICILFAVFSKRVQVRISLNFHSCSFEPGRPVLFSF